MHKAFPLLVRKFSPPEGTSHCLKKNATARRKVMPLPEDCTAVTRLLSVLIILEDPNQRFQQVVSELGKFEQWQFQMQQYLQHEHYAMWEVIEFEDSYEAPENNPSTTTTSTTSGEKSGRTVTLTTEDMLKKKNDTFTRLQVIVGQLQFIGVEVEQDDLNQKRRNDEVNTASVYTTSSNVPTASVNVTTASISQKIACAYIASQSGKKISIQGSDVVGFDKSKVECFNCHKMGHFARECKAPRNQDRGRRDTYRQRSKAKEQAPKALMAIDGVGWDWSYMANEEEDHALVAEALTEFALMANTSTENKAFPLLVRKFPPPEGTSHCLKKNATARRKVMPLPEDCTAVIFKKKLSVKDDGFLKNSAPYPALYSSSNQFVNDTVTDYSSPSPTVESTLAEGQNKHSTTTENGESTDSILSKPAVKFVKAGDRPAKRPTTDKVETAKKPAIRYAEMYRRTSKRKRVQRETTWSQNHAYKSPFHRSYGAPMRPSHRPAGHRPHGHLMRPMRSNMNGARPKRTSAVRPQYRAP
nr:hypothetical protein [Tanacetum cinerariifolium]